MEVALFSALHFLLLLQSRRMWPPLWLWDFVLLQFMAALGLLSMAGSPRPCTAAADAIFFQNEGFEIAVYEEKVRFKRAPYKAEMLHWFYGGSNTQEGPIPQDTDCPGTNNSGCFVSGGSQLSWDCTLETQPVILQPWQHSPPLRSMKLQALINEIAGSCHLWGDRPSGTRVSWESVVFHTHPLHCSALAIHWEVRWQHLSAITLQTDRQMQFANGTEGFYKYLHFKHICPAFTGICQLWWVSVPWTLE